MASQTREVTQRRESVGKEKRKPVRRDPERRRQQNIQAQKKYREKLRERLDHLEALAASAAQSRAIERTQGAGIDPSEAVTTYGSSSTSTHIIAQSLPASNASDVSIPSLSAATSGEYQYLTPKSDESPRECHHPTPQSDDTSSAMSIWESTTHVDPCLLMRDKHNDGLDSSATTLECQHLTPRSDESPGECRHPTPQSDETSSAMSRWDSTTHVDPSLLIRDTHSVGLGPYWMTMIDCGCSNPHVQIRTRGPDPFTYGEVRILTFGHSATGADPYANNLRIESICIASALYNLGMCVGITEEMLCADKSLSPFFRPSAESADDTAKENMICTVQRIFKTLKPDLRPSSEQITVKHHPYIDILPFPTLRKNLIKHQEEVDDDEFFNDMLTGLLCWGGAGIGKKDREESTRYASTGTPWDVRSWEAKEWFLKKYWTLLGGEDGELVRQSEWWRSIRGEDTLNMEVHS